jgi:uncharacterized damage-inducible protein DinB
MNARKELLEAFGKMESERQKLLKHLEQYSEEVLIKKPTVDSWSVTETIYHLKVAENGALLYMRKKLEVGGHQKATFGSAVKQKLLNFAVSLPFKYKAPSVAQVPKGTKVSYPEAVVEWNDVREALKNDYETIDESIIGNELFKHPAAGKLSIIQSVKFMRQHVVRHVGQIDRILKQVS